MAWRRIRTILDSIGAHTHEGTHLCLEIGQGQGPAVIELAKAAGWQLTQMRPDLGGIDRALAFSRKGIK